jgi:hypothetical protein
MTEERWFDHSIEEVCSGKGRLKAALEEGT